MLEELVLLEQVMQSWLPNHWRLEMTYPWCITCPKFSVKTLIKISLSNLCKIRTCKAPIHRKCTVPDLTYSIKMKYPLSFTVLGYSTSTVFSGGTDIVNILAFGSEMSFSLAMDLFWTSQNGSSALLSLHGALLSQIHYSLPQGLGAWSTKSDWYGLFKGAGLKGTFCTYVIRSAFCQVLCCPMNYMGDWLHQMCSQLGWEGYLGHWL